MNRLLKILTVLLFICLIPVTHLISQDTFDETDMPVPGEKKAYSYYDDGTIKTVKILFSNGESAVKKFNEFGMLVEKEYSSGTVVTYDYNFDEGTKAVIETISPANIKIKRIFNDKGEIVSSIYPDHKEDYTYVYDDIGDITKVIVKKESGVQEELSPDNENLSFLKDYDIIESESNSLIRDTSEKEYLFNPAKYKDKMMMKNKFEQ